jgi:uncharacterized protein (DUF1330 family)
MENEITLIIKATINTEEVDSFNSYVEKLTILFAKVNAEQIGYYPVKETFVGNDLPTFITIFKLADRKALSAVYETEEYKSTMIPLRNKGFRKLEVYLS